jgi:hypothetical protein
MDVVTAKFGGIFFEIWLSNRDNASFVAQDEHPVGRTQSRVACTRLIYSFLCSA